MVTFRLYPFYLNKKKKKISLYQCVGVLMPDWRKQKKKEGVIVEALIKSALGGQSSLLNLFNEDKEGKSYVCGKQQFNR